MNLITDSVNDGCGISFAKSGKGERGVVDGNSRIQEFGLRSRTVCGIEDNRFVILQGGNQIFFPACDGRNLPVSRDSIGF